MAEVGRFGSCGATGFMARIEVGTQILDAAIPNKLDLTSTMPTLKRFCAEAQELRCVGFCHDLVHDQKL